MVAEVVEVAVSPGLGVPIKDQEWERAGALVNQAQRILLCAHKKPDGDAVGSLLGFGHALESMGKQVTMACADQPGEWLEKLPGAERIVNDLSSLYVPAGDLPWDLVISLDSSGLDRLGSVYEANPALFERLPVIDLDHHFTNERFGIVNLVDPSAASATEVVTLFLEHLDVKPNVPAATCLLAGMMTDSLSFQTESTTSRTLRQAASLVDAGAPIAGIAYQLFRRRTLPGALLYSKAMGTLQFAAGHRIAWFEVTRAMVEESSAQGDGGGLSGFAGSIAGVDVGMSISEGEDGNIYAGFRSQSVDVAQIASQFGGGGHKRAAGCHFDAPATIADARAKLIPAIEAALPPSSA